MFSICRVPNGAAPSPNSIEQPSKEIFVEAPLVEDIKSVLEDGKNDSIPLQKQSTAASSEEEPVHKDELPTEGTPLEVNRTESAGEALMKEPNELNLTVEENQIPVFSEWAQKRLEEVEKEVEQEAVNASTNKKNASTASKPPVLKLKNLKNYASPDCGAKIIAANSESSGTGYVLTKTKDEYLLSPCKSRIWFVVELCEAIQAERIDLANFELFSSSPKNFSVSLSHRFPTREWRNVGRYIAKDERYIQSFDLYPHLFGKYLRVDIHSHYNSEHFCPISLFRAYGTSELEAFDSENRPENMEYIDEDDDDDQESDPSKSKPNFLKSAGAAVMSIVDTVKKSFGKNENATATSDSQNASNSLALKKNCISPNHAITCENCSEETTRKVIALLECKHQELKRLLNTNFIRNSLYKSRICNTLIGSDLNINCNELAEANDTTSKQLSDMPGDYITRLFSLEYVIAMCNLLAANDRKFVWNSTIPATAETPINVTIVKKAGDQLLRTDQIKQKPTVQTAPTVQTDPVVESRSQENSVEGQTSTEQQVNVPSDSSEKSQEPAVNDKSAEVNEGDKIEPTTVSPPIESNEVVADKNEQNIFNVVDSTETSEEKPAPQVPVIETPTTDPANQHVDAETPPTVIILPETTVTTPPAPSTTATTNDVNDVNEDQAQNGWTNTPQFGQKLHSESVFLRLSNRVKVIQNIIQSNQSH